MKRLIATLLMVSTMLVGFQVTATPASAHHVRRLECRYQLVDGRQGWNSQEVKSTIQCAANKWGVSVEHALYIAHRESGLGQFATNSSSYACGVFQHIPRYFTGRLYGDHSVPDRMRPFGSKWTDQTPPYGARSRCYNARDNILAALWMVHKYGWGAWGG